MKYSSIHKWREFRNSKEEDTLKTLRRKRQSSAEQAGEEENICEIYYSLEEVVFNYMSIKEMHAADIPSANNLYPSYCIINPLSLARLVESWGK